MLQMSIQFMNGGFVLVNLDVIVFLCALIWISVQIGWVIRGKGIRVEPEKDGECTGCFFRFVCQSIEASELLMKGMDENNISRCTKRIIYRYK